MPVSYHEGDLSMFGGIDVEASLVPGSRGDMTRVFCTFGSEREPLTGHPAEFYYHGFQPLPIANAK
jgi:hypothetical protein